MVVDEGRLGQVGGEKQGHCLKIDWRNRADYQRKAVLEVHLEIG